MSRGASREEGLCFGYAPWSNNVPLADVKTVTKALGAKVNDVVLSALAGGLRDYLIARPPGLWGGQQAVQLSAGAQSFVPLS